MAGAGGGAQPAGDPRGAGSRGWRWERAATQRLHSWGSCALFKNCRLTDDDPLTAQEINIEEHSRNLKKRKKQNGIENIKRHSL